MHLCVFFLCVRTLCHCAFYVFLCVFVHIHVHVYTLCAAKHFMCVCVSLCVFACTCACPHHALLVCVCVCAPASANQDDFFRILTPSFHHILSQSQAADESQVPAGLTWNRQTERGREREKILTLLHMLIVFQLLLFFSCTPSYALSTPHYTPESTCSPLSGQQLILDKVKLTQLL